MYKDGVRWFVGQCGGNEWNTDAIQPLWHKHLSSLLHCRLLCGRIAANIMLTRLPLQCCLSCESGHRVSCCKLLADHCNLNISVSRCSTLDNIGVPAAAAACTLAAVVNSRQLVGNDASSLTLQPCRIGLERISGLGTLLAQES